MSITLQEAQKMGGCTKEVRLLNAKRAREGNFDLQSKAPEGCPEAKRKCMELKKREQEHNVPSKLEQLNLPKPPPEVARESKEQQLVVQKQNDALSVIRSANAKKFNQWSLSKIISGHAGWIQAICMDWGNEWFATGSDDRSIKLWDLATGHLKLTLTGHIAAVRGLAISKASPYLFSCGEDKTVKCWDLEVNRQVRHYHGHLSGVYCCDIHPTADLLMTGGRDGTVRLWDIRTKKEVQLLAGHKHTVWSVKGRSEDPQVISGSQDSTVRGWDLRAGSKMMELTHHKKAVRAIAVPPNDNSYMVTGGADNIKKFAMPDGTYRHNFAGQNTIIHSLSINHDGVLASGGWDGTLKFWDTRNGTCIQTMDTVAAPGSLEAETSIFCSTFDKTGSRLLTGEADKTIKIWRENEAE